MKTKKELEREIQSLTNRLNDICEREIGNRWDVVKCNYAITEFMRRKPITEELNELKEIKDLLLEYLNIEIQEKRIIKRK